jgi:hypothetical protein
MYWEITKNQFGTYKIMSHAYVGKKIKSLMDPNANEKKFQCKKEQFLGLGVVNSFPLFFPKNKLFWTKHAAIKFSNEHANGLHPENTVMHVVSRIRRQK